MFKSTEFLGFICAGDIEPSKCLMDYITGHGQFYIENSYYVQPSIRAGAKRPFVDNDYLAKQGAGGQVHAPTIYYHHADGQYYSPSRYSILWKMNALSDGKTFKLQAPYGGIDEKTKKPIKLSTTESKIKTYSIGVFSRSPFSKSPEDAALSIITFHFNEVLSILAYAYIFEINLADAKYSACKDNVTFYKLYAADINAKLEAAGVKQRVKIDEESIKAFNNPVAYIQDPDCFEDIKPSVPAMLMDDTYVPMMTLQRSINEFYMEARKSRVDASKYLSANKVNFMNKLALIKYESNKCMLKTYQKDDDPEWKQLFAVKSDFTFINTSDEAAAETCKGLCTHVYGDKDEFEPLKNEEELMTYYNTTLRGEMYIVPEFKISLFAKSAYGLHIKTARFDCVRVQNTDSSLAAATRLAREKRERERIASTITMPETEQNEDSDITLSE